MAYAFFEVVPSIDIKVADGIVFDLSIFPQFFFGFGAYWSQAVMITYLNQDWAASVPDVFGRSVSV